MAKNLMDFKQVLCEEDLGLVRDWLKDYTDVDFMGLLTEALSQNMLVHQTGEIIHKLVEMGFFTAPASSKYHGAEPGCLFVHSFLMYLTLEKWTKSLGLKWERKSGLSPLLVGILHDLCKCDSYTAVIDDYDDEPTIRYDYNKDQFPLGHHALASLVYAQQLFKLNMEEIACIRWHMGSYEESQWDNYDKAIKLYQNVLWTHNADMYVSKVLGV